MAEPQSSPSQSPPPPSGSGAPVSFLLLAVSLLLLAGAIFFVIYRSKNAGSGGGGTPPATGTGSRDGGRDAGGGGVLDPRVRSAMDLVEGDFGGSAAADWESKARSLANLQQERQADISNENRYLTNAGRKPMRHVPALSEADAKRRKEHIEALAALGPALDVEKAVRGAFPSSKGDERDTNRGIESLAAWLDRAGRLEACGFATGDTDGDGRRELIDAWGNPLIYFSGDDYGTRQDVSRIRSDERDASGAIFAHQRFGWVDQEGRIQLPYSEESRQYFDDGRWQAEQRYQLWSCGPNGTDDGGSFDDASSWGLR
ncbi:MAG: hypothetical protein HMLKMBBP_01782 [Planctomycetes bacterium]|nr:hypothetical protein [Planctomycetota bacterium]